MLERAKAVTRHEKWTASRINKFADDLIILVEAQPCQPWLRQALLSSIVSGSSGRWMRLLSPKGKKRTAWLSKLRDISFPEAMASKTWSMWAAAHIYRTVQVLYSPFDASCNSFADNC